MTSSLDKQPAPPKVRATPSDQVLKGQYIGVLRSSKGKLKGLQLQSGQKVEQIKLPKYLRPILLRELEPGTFVQVWVNAYKDDRWQAVNLMPLPPSEIDMLLQDACLPDSNSYVEAAPVRKKTCQRIQVCRKGTCYKRGGSELWQALQREIATNPQLQDINLEKTGCLKACKQGPNVRVLPSGKLLKGVRPSHASAVLSNYQGVQ
jgi:(2Fe-2S) ferredoxin